MYRQLLINKIDRVLMVLDIKTLENVYYVLSDMKYTKDEKSLAVFERVFYDGSTRN